MSAFLLLLITPLVSSYPYYYHSYRPTAYYSYHPTAYSSYYPTALYSHGLRSLQLPFNQGCLPAFGLSVTRCGGDIIQQTRTQADSLKATLKYLASTTGPAEILNRIINNNNNVCLNSVEEAIEAVEASAKIVEDAAPEIKQLTETVTAFEKLTDTTTVVREAANILRLLEVLMPKLAPASPSICAATNAEAFGSLRSLAALVDELSSTTDIYLTPQTRQDLKKSEKIISGVTTFVTQLNKSFSKFEKFCTSDKEYNIEAITAIGEMMTGLADLFGVLGGLSDAEQIRKQGDFTKKVVANINKLGDLDLGTLECDTPGSFKVAADTLDDLAGIIEEVGIDKLAEELGWDLDFTF